MELHEHAHAILHVGIDERGEQCSLVTYGGIVDEIHESLAQLIAARAIAKRVSETTDERARAVWQRLQTVEFPALESSLTDVYRLWREFDHLSPERLPRVLLALRRATPLNQWSGFTLLR